ncbi:MAG: hypothetical protein AAGK09_01305 [Planctomycetota bacterium]
MPGPEIDPILVRLRSCCTHDIEEGVGLAADLFDEMRMHTNELATDPRAQAIREELIKLTNRDLRHPNLHGALWALSKVRDPSLQPVFVECMYRSFNMLRMAEANLWQTIYALADAGVDELRVSGGCLDFDRNHQLALEYLKKLGMFEIPDPH